MTPFLKAMPLPPRRDLVDSIVRECRRRGPAAEGLRNTLGLAPSTEITADHVLQLIRDYVESREVWKNDTYQVSVQNPCPVGHDWPAMAHLSIKRLDKQPIHDWRDLQEIKNLLIGREHEAIELYPAESRLVDSANQYHLWVMLDSNVRLPFGFTERYVSELEYGGVKQRPLNHQPTEEHDARPVPKADGIPRHRGASHDQGAGDSRTQGASGNRSSARRRNQARRNGAGAGTGRSRRRRR